MTVPNKTRLQYLSWLTLFGMSAIGVLLINYCQTKPLKEVLLGGKPYYFQALMGIFFGSLSALLGAILIRGKHFKGVRTFFEAMIGDINPSFVQILFYSFCAGVGEEVLFRAGLQPIIGIWPTALLFVLLHGYINPSQLSVTIYGLFLVIICAGFGYLFKYFGLISTILAHIVYDIAMFSLLKYAPINFKWKRKMENQLHDK